MHIARFAEGLIVVVLSALMLAEGVLGRVTGTSLFYEDVKFVVRLITIILAASFMPEGKK